MSTPARIAVAGSSAGAALAARLAQRAAEGAAPPVVFQLLHQPVLDDRPTPSKDEFLADPGLRRAGRRCRCGGTTWRRSRSPLMRYPAACDELTGVASALITCSELDPLRDEAIDYARD